MSFVINEAKVGEVTLVTVTGLPWGQSEVVLSGHIGLLKIRTVRGTKSLGKESIDVNTYTLLNDDSYAYHWEEKVGAGKPGLFR